MHRIEARTSMTCARSQRPPRRQVINHKPVQFTEEEATMIDLEAPSHTPEEHRKGPKRAVLAGLLAAAVVAAIALVAIRNDDPASPADQPSPTAPAFLDLAATCTVRHTRRAVRFPTRTIVDEVDGVCDTVDLCHSRRWLDQSSATTGRIPMDRISVSSRSADPTECSWTPATPVRGSTLGR